MKRIMLSIGDVVVSKEPAMLETILGSCVAVCLWDEKIGMGGMNHIMLPRMYSGIKNPLYCGHESIHMLLNKLLEGGASKKSLKAKVFGGGRVIKEISEHFDVGKENVKTAKEILRQHGIPIIREFTGCGYGTKVLFHSATGRAFVKRLIDIQGQI
ncbi:MAG: chemotaxis protein CheD [Nitrospirae bacterium]|nr:chemotaxis protein CheD [Nitrospirota bacterium]MDA8214974.1 chemotaxis protein CheD [Nitrospiraceae bacterium]